MILISRRHASAVIDWLDANVAPNEPYQVPDSERTEHSRKNPYRVSVTAQVAYWQSKNKEWHVKQWGRKNRIEVTCADPQLECYIALRWSQ